jgi:uncharacterized protein
MRQFEFTCWRPVFLLVASAMLSGCAGMGLSDLFVSYSTTMQPVRTQLQLGQWQEARTEIPLSEPSDNNFVLDRLQQGRIAFLLRDWSASKQSLDAAATQLEWLDQQAEYRLSHGLQQAGSLLSNDQAIAYQAPDYEQTFLHHYQALNYLFLGQTQDALVEIRKANQVQERALAVREREVQAAEEEIQQAGLTQALALAQSGLPELSSDNGGIKGKIQSGYTFYLSASLYEATGALNDAYVDYQRALDVAPNNPVVHDDLLRVTARMGLKTEHAAYLKRFGSPSAASNTVNAPSAAGEQGTILLLSEEGMVAPLQEFFLPLPIATSGGDFRTFTVAFPWYSPAAGLPASAPLLLDGQMAQTAPLVSLQALASQSLQERLPGLVMRQLLRLSSKEALRHEASQQGGDLGNILVGLYNTFSEHADTRSWSTLPSGVSIWRRSARAGSHTLTIGSGATQQQLSVPVSPGKVTLVWVNQLGVNIVSMVKMIS